MNAEPRTILFATGNPHKVEEVAEILGAAWHVEAQDPDVEETGTTLSLIHI